MRLRWQLLLVLLCCTMYKSMAQCSINFDGITPITCNGNMVNFDVALTPMNGSGSYIITLNSITIASGTASPISITLFDTPEILSTFSILDANDLACGVVFTATIPECPSTVPCSITNISNSPPQCNNGSLTFDVFYTPTNGSGLYSIRDANNNNLVNATSNPISLTIDEVASGTLDFTIFDGNDPTCSTPFQVVVPNDCFTACNLFDASASSISCFGDAHAFNIFFNFEGTSGPFELIDATGNVLIQNIQAVGSNNFAQQLIQLNSTAAMPNTALTVRDMNDPSCATDFNIDLPDCVNCLIGPVTVGSLQCSTYEGRPVYFLNITFDVANTNGDLNFLDGNGDVIGSIPEGQSEITMRIEDWTIGMNNFSLQAANIPACQRSFSYDFPDCVPQSTCNISNASVSNLQCHDDGVSFVLNYQALNSSDIIEVYDVDNDLVVGFGDPQIATVILALPIPASKTLVLRDRENNSCSFEVVVDLSSCNGNACSISNLLASEITCDNNVYMAAISFDATGSTGPYQAFDANDVLLGSSATSPIQIKIDNPEANTQTIIISSVSDQSCESEIILDLPSCEMSDIHAIPTMGQWGLIILYLLLSILALISVSQRENTLASNRHSSTRS